MSQSDPRSPRPSLRRAPIAVAAVMVLLASCGSDADEGANSDGASVTFESPTDGARLAGGIDLVMAAGGIVIEPAGEVTDGAGHFHVIADAGCVATGDAIARNADHVHFGSGTSTGTVYLEPGTHTLCLQVGDGQHAALDITDTIEVEVGVTSQGEFCDVATEIDTLVSALGDHDFEAARAAAVNARRLVAQLAASTKFVDDAVRDDVDQLVAFFGELLDAYVNAESSAEAEAAAWGPEGVMANYTEDEIAAIEASADPWFQSTCGISVFD